MVWERVHSELSIVSTNTLGNWNPDASVLNEAVGVSTWDMSLSHTPDGAGPRHGTLSSLPPHLMALNSCLP